MFNMVFMVLMKNNRQINKNVFILFLLCSSLFLRWIFARDGCPQMPSNIPYSRKIPSLADCLSFDPRGRPKRCFSLCFVLFCCSFCFVFGGPGGGFGGPGGGFLLNSLGSGFAIAFATT